MVLVVSVNIANDCGCGRIQVDPVKAAYFGGLLLYELIDILRQLIDIYGADENIALLSKLDAVGNFDKSLDRCVNIFTAGSLGACLEIVNEKLVTPVCRGPGYC